VSTPRRVVRELEDAGTRYTIEAVEDGGKLGVWIKTFRSGYTGKGTILNHVIHVEVVERKLRVHAYYIEVHPDGTITFDERLRLEVRGAPRTILTLERIARIETLGGFDVFLEELRKSVEWDVERCLIPPR
jgi:hypothetical protein